ncbi:MAG TPA: hypothetical protein HPP64_02400 [Gammaproteobacteria bacterium]|jgi:hypothetical protein|nr:hypothetical protein [Gammaproteobacteria bacterium]HIJ21756.1 hypothetical protein [Gammaproteobacteria bacterium]
MLDYDLRTSGTFYSKEPHGENGFLIVKSLCGECRQYWRSGGAMVREMGTAL